MRVTGEAKFDERLKKRLDLAGGGVGLTETECRAYLEFYRSDIARLISEIHSLRQSISDVGSFADLIATTGEPYRDDKLDPVATAHFFSNSFRSLYVSILNQLSKHGLPRRDLDHAESLRLWFALSRTAKELISISDPGGANGQPVQ